MAPVNSLGVPAGLGGGQFQTGGGVLPHPIYSGDIIMPRYIIWPWEQSPQLEYLVGVLVTAGEAPAVLSYSSRLAPGVGVPVVKGRRAVGSEG